MRAARRHWHPLLALGFGALAALLPRVANDYVLQIAIGLLLFAYLGSCWDIIGGYAGQPSFGQAAFYGIGASASATLFGLFVGYLSFRYRLKGWYFGLVTLASAEVLLVLAQNFARGKAAGILMPLRPDSWLEFQFASKQPYYYLILGLTVAMLLFMCWLQGSRFGLNLMALRDDEEAATATGVPAMREKLTAMGLSAFLTALGGSFWAQFTLKVDPNIAFNINTTISIGLRPVVGGLGTMFGPLLGSLILTPLGEFTRNAFAKEGTALVAYGVLLILVARFLPRGLLPFVASQARRIASTPARPDEGGTRDTSGPRSSALGARPSYEPDQPAGGAP